MQGNQSFVLDENITCVYLINTIIIGYVDRHLNCTTLLDSTIYLLFYWSTNYFEKFTQLWNVYVSARGNMRLIEGLVYFRG